MQKQQITQKQKLKQVISQQTIQLMRLIEFSNNNLEQEILKEIEENPALEIDNETEYLSNFDKSTDNDHDVNDNNDQIELTSDQLYENDDYDDYYQSDEYDQYLFGENNLNDSNTSAEKKSFDSYLVSAPSFHEYLMNQLQDFPLSETDLLLAQYIIGYIDDSGYLMTDLYSISTDFLLSHNICVNDIDVERVLTSVIHQMDPEGVGARDLQESLLIQLYRKDTSEVQKIAIQIIKNYFDEFSKKQYEKILKKLKIDKDLYMDAVDLITHLNPKPIFPIITADNNAQDITPDFIITIESNSLQLQLNNPYLPKLQISNDFKNTFAKYNKKLSEKQREEAEKFIKENIDNAQQFINALNLRELVLYNTMYAIMDMQRDYFFTGDEKYLKPMILKDIAEKVNLDISTISRVSNSKYVQTFFGTISLKQLFSESIGDDLTSSKEVKQIIKEILENEDRSNPLQDEEIMKILNEKGYPIARRTISKYRKQLNIPVARLRVKL